MPQIPTSQDIQSWITDKIHGKNGIISTEKFPNSSHFYMLIGGLSTGILIMGWRAGMQRYMTAAHIPPNVITKQRPIRGWVVDVGDGDNCRIYHTPLLRWFGRIPDAFKKRRGISSYTINVRLAGVDAPEASHFGNPSQPFSKEARECLTRILKDKRVTVVPYRKDQYGRIVGMVYYRKWGIFSHNASEDLLKAGFAEVYVGDQAEYGDILNTLKKLERNARQKRIGMWSQSKSSYVSPQEYKKNIRNTHQD
ncbi:putative endonuclease lcl3 [Mycoemilia scoparia]|uniref:Endonuclease lcl3 n=1 Tax=Mycoemilia scoparia TaxID=417184 RepID=A0A9W8DPW7_9FUNG|nr:putative endonuclease lcl3 [Mycoemilia scoparia]